jgi:hypothetical protein
MELKVRELRESDWETLVSWWSSWEEWRCCYELVESVSNGVSGVRDESYEEVVVDGFVAKVVWENLPKGDGCAP